MAVELKQFANDVEIVGTLKTKDLEEKLQETALKDGTKVQQSVIRGSIVVEFIDKQENINNVRTQVFVGDKKRDGGHNKMFDSYKTILDEYKDKDNFGDEADFVRVTGEIQLHLQNCPCLYIHLRLSCKNRTSYCDHHRASYLQQKLVFGHC